MSDRAGGHRAGGFAEGRGYLDLLLVLLGRMLMPWLPRKREGRAASKRVLTEATS